MTKLLWYPRLPLSPLPSITLPVQLFFIFFPSVNSNPLLTLLSLSLSIIFLFFLFLSYFFSRLYGAASANLSVAETTSATSQDGHKRDITGVMWELERKRERETKREKGGGRRRTAPPMPPVGFGDLLRRIGRWCQEETEKWRERCENYQPNNHIKG